MKTISVFLFAAALLTSLPAAELRSDHPDVYIVQKGDTLWDIAGRFFSQPWLWPEIWQNNPQIADPHWIYPGDEIRLVYIDGQPRLVVNDDRRYQKVKDGVVYLSPRVRVLEDKVDAIPVVPLEVIRPYLTRSFILEDNALETMPEIVAFPDRHLIAGPGQKVYVSGMDPNSEQMHFDIVRQGKAYHSAEGELLGYVALYAGDAVLSRQGDPATAIIRKAETEVLVGDRLMPSVRINAVDFYPKAPDFEVEGQIIAVLNRISQMGQYDILLLDKGEREGLEPGMVLRVDRKGEIIKQKDEHFFYTQTKTIELPNEKAALIMVFRTFEKLSLAIVMDAIDALHVGDRFITPGHD